MGKDITLLSGDAACERKLRRNHLMFHAVVGLFVVVCSFVYGLVYGLSKHAPSAQASFPMFAQGALGEGANYVPATREDLPHGIYVMPVGKDVAIAGKQAALLSFVSKRGVKNILTEQVKKWEAQGMIALGAGTTARGVALAIDKSSGERFVINVWKVPPSLKKLAANGMPVQGIISKTTGGLFPELGESEKEGLVPGVPLYPGGKPGAVFSSQEGAVRSYSSMYRNAGPVEETVSFYRRELPLTGWSVREGAIMPRGSSNVGHLTFEREEEELTLLFVPVEPKVGLRKSETMETMTFVLLGPRQERIG
jgi:hypothetical protein